MRYWMMAFVLFLSALAQAGVAQSGDEAKTAVCALKITGMTCGGCEGAVKVAAKKVEGVRSVTASHETGTAEVTLGIVFLERRVGF